MIILPDFQKAFEYENNFYLSCDPSRMGKILSHYELYKKIIHLPGAIVECGVFKGSSFVRFVMFSTLFEAPKSRWIIGFDVFGKYPKVNFHEDIPAREKFVNEAGEEGIEREQLLEILNSKNVNKRIELVKGDICVTVPEFVRKNPELKIALLNMDADNYEPSKVILQYFYPRVINGGVVIFDDYGTYPGETKAVDEYFADQKIQIQKFPFSYTPSFVIKE